MEEDTSSMNLFKKYLANKNIFRNREVLRHSYRPLVLPHREPEIEGVASILAASLKGETPSNILIYGKTGTGKTACVRYVGAELENASRETEIPCHVIHLNCEVIDTQYRVLAQIAKTLEEHEERPSDGQRPNIPFTGWPTDQVYMELKNKLDSIGGVMVIVLDEIDKLVKKSGDETLYNLTRINSDLRSAKVAIIGISNDLRFTDFLDPRVLSSLSEEEIVFPPYNAPQLADILTQRAQIAFNEGVLDANVIPVCAALAATEHGDARRALDLLRVSGELAERENTERVSEKHVRQAQEKIDTDSMIECVSTLPTQSKVVLYSMLVLDQNGKKLFTSGEVLNVYREVAKDLSLDILTNRRITDLVSELNMLGVINTRVVSKGRYGRTKEMWFDTSTHRIRETLAKDQRLEQETLKRMDANRLKTIVR